MFKLTPIIGKPKSQKHLPPFNWVMFTLLVVCPFLFVPSLLTALLIHGGWLKYITMFVVTYGLCILSIGVYHRYWTHKSFEFNDTPTAKFICFLTRLYGVLAGAFTGQGDAISWILRHWLHHLNEDIPGKDHHTPNEYKSTLKGFIWSHVGWLCYIKIGEFDYENHSASKRAELEKDPLLVWQNKNYLALYIICAAVFPVLLGLIISVDFWSFILGQAYNVSEIYWSIGLTFLTINCARMACQHATFFVNSACHIWGKAVYQNHKTGAAKDNWWVAILVFGEGFHSGHHAFGYSYEHGIIHDGNKSQWRAKLMYVLDIHARIIDLFDILGLLKYKLKPTSAEAMAVHQKQVLFSLEAALLELSEQFYTQKESLKGQFDAELRLAKDKITSLTGEHKEALFCLIEQLEAAITSFKLKIEALVDEGSPLVKFWQSRQEKAEQDLRLYRAELSAISK
tara:strand:+ start:42894 stop:44255 length:1362 start_codon:yes stop_codon:yes gene_type:complete